VDAGVHQVLFLSQATDDCTNTISELEETQKFLSSSLQEKQQLLSEMQATTDVLEEEINQLTALKRQVNILGGAWTGSIQAGWPP
jgi:chromosome segregation ATPase